MGRLRLYRRYATRALRRGGSRSLLAIFCIAVGVLAIVALRLVGDMITVSVTTNVRQANGGDVSLQSTSVPLTANDLDVFRSLQQQGQITAWEALGLGRGTVRRSDGQTLQVTTFIVDNPQNFPLVGTTKFDTPADGSFGSTLQQPQSLVITRFIADQIGLHAGDSLRLNLIGANAAQVTVSGIIANQNGLGGPLVAYISGATYAQMSTRPEQYGIVGVTTSSDAQSAAVAQRLRDDFPVASVQTVQEAEAQNQQAADNLNQFLEMVGLLALLIGGIGIVNTLQVLLSRRRIEIAVLKTVGYRRRDLYALFGLETALLGLIGGLLGTGLGYGLSFGVKALVERVFAIDLASSSNWVILSEGLIIGVVTSLIFGVLPIVRAAAIRPQEVIRDQAENRPATTVATTLLLYLAVAALFVIFASVVLGNLVLAFFMVLGTAVVLGLLALGFLIVVLIIGVLPVPERARPGFLLLVTAAVLASAALAIAYRGVGIAMAVLFASGYLVLLLRRRPRNIVKLALRSLSRARTRTSSTMTALFIGVFTVGLILIVGQDLTATVNNALSSFSDYSVFLIASPSESAQAQSLTATLPGLQARRVTVDVGVQPTTIAGQDAAAFIAGHQHASTGGDREDRNRITGLAGVEAYDLAGGTIPDTTASRGRSLTAADGGSTNVMVPQQLFNAPYSLKTGDTVTITVPPQGSSKTPNPPVQVTIVGFYQPTSRSQSGIKIKFFFEPILGDRALIAKLNGTAASNTVVSMQIDPNQKLAALSSIERTLPNAAVIDLADIAAQVQQILGNLIDLLVAIASLALFAGLVIIANTVALAMLERRRELGILKSTGHTSRSVLAQVLIENGVVGAVAAVAGMLAVSVATYPLSKYALKTDLAVSTPITLAVIGGIVLVVLLVTTLVAWSPARIRPLEVLRYE